MYFASMFATSPHLVSGSGHLLLNAETDVPAHTTTLVVGVSNTAKAGVIAVLRDLGLCFDGRGRGRSAFYVEDAASLSGRRALRRFAAPRLIVISHDPVALIEELGETESDTRRGLARARDRIDLVFKIALRSKCPVLVLSHALARGSRSELRAVVASFCGIGIATTAALPSPESADTEPIAARQGIVALRLASMRSCNGAARTIVIGGPPRSGTSMIAAVLHAAGLPLGGCLVPSTFENVVQNTLFKPSSSRPWTGLLKGSWKAAVANPRHVRLAWHGFDVPGIKALVADRCRDGPVWGFKRPGIGSFIRLGGFRLLTGPRLIISLRDPVATAARITLAHGLTVEVALRMARWFLLDSLETARCCNAPTLLVSHDVFRNDLSGLFDRLLSFCGLKVDAGRYEAIAASVERSGATYRKDFAAPIVGEIMHIFKDDLYGWIEEGLGRPVAVDIFAGDRQIACGLADEVLADGRLLFVARLPPGAVTSATSIRAFVSSSRAELRHSGCTLAELRRS